MRQLIALPVEFQFVLAAFFMRALDLFAESSMARAEHPPGNTRPSGDEDRYRRDLKPQRLPQKGTQNIGATEVQPPPFYLPLPLHRSTIRRPSGRVKQPHRKVISPSFLCRGLVHHPRQVVA